jgi:FtsH-binding integral membrane protein
MYQDPQDQFLVTQNVASVQAAFMTKVYGWMTLALAITGLVAWFTAASPGLVEFIFTNAIIKWGLIIGTFLMVGSLALAVQKMSPAVATLVFIGYSALNGLLFSSLFFMYTSGSLALTFFITAGTFGAMSIYGYTTKADLTKIGNIAFMALVGVIIASLANMFLQSESLYWIISYVGVAVFVALVAYDTQKLKDMAVAGFDGAAMERKASIMGALSLYLDFINLFLMLLRLFGGRRD